MTAVDDFLHELAKALHVRGRSRRRLLVECREHLTESSAAFGTEEAIRRFGSAAELARAFELEVAARRARRATAVSAVGVVGVGGSALAMINAADAHASAPLGWAVVFFGAAQVSAVSLVLALLQAAAMRSERGSPADAALLCRRNAYALGFALLTIFAVGAAVPGQTAAWRILSGPAVAAIAVASVIRAYSLARKLDPHPPSVVRPPLTDAAALAGFAWREHPVALLVPTVLVAMAAAFAWDSLDHGTVAQAGVAAAVEAALTVTAFVFLGRALGLHGVLGPRQRA